MRLIGSIIALAGLCLVFWTGLKTGAAERSVGDSRFPVSPSARFAAPSGVGYASADDIESLLASWAAADPDRLRLVPVAEVSGRAPVWAIEFASRPLYSGTGFPLTVLLMGGADGVSLVGGEAVVQSTYTLLQHLDELRSDVRVIAIPQVAPGALMQVPGQSNGAALPSWSLDEDQDGEEGEDPPDDLDGDGFTLDMLIEAPEGEWCLASDRRVLIPAGPHDAPRYLLTKEGRDDDLDGLHNEDGPSGLDWGRSFPVGWPGPLPDGSCGTRPMEDPLSRAIADYVLDLDPTLTLVFAGNHGGLRFFGGSADGDASERVVDMRARLTAGFSRATGRRMGSAAAGRSLVPTAKVAAPTGSFGDWLQTVTRGTVVEVSPWGPTAVWIDGRPLADAAEDGMSLPRPLDQSGDLLEMGREPDPVSALWMRWLDEVRGGAGFVDWHPVDLGGGVTGLVGGWEPMTRNNPPAELLPLALEGISPFVSGVIAGLPRYEIEVLEATRDGSLVRIRARVANRSALDPVAPGPDASGEGVSGRDGVELHLESTCDAAIMVGGASVHLGELRPGAVSAPVTWVLEAPAGGVIALRASGPSGHGVEREVRP